MFGIDMICNLVRAFGEAAELLQQNPIGALLLVLLLLCTASLVHAVRGRRDSAIASRRRWRPTR